jgi:hypothetical protein
MNKLRFLLALGLAAPALAHNGVVHEAPHGGIMRPVKNAHAEIQLAPKGGVRIYFYDEKTKPLPATAASDLSVEIDRPGQKTEYVNMKPDRSNTLWMGDSKPVTDPKSVVRVGTVVQGQSGIIEVPRSAFPNYDEHAEHEEKGKAHAH